jgi:hypothetical protein
MTTLHAGAAGLLVSSGDCSGAGAAIEVSRPLGSEIRQRAPNKPGQLSQDEIERHGVGLAEK